MTTRERAWSGSRLCPRCNINYCCLYGCWARNMQMQTDYSQCCKLITGRVNRNMQVCRLTKASQSRVRGLSSQIPLCSQGRRLDRHRIGRSSAVGMPYAPQAVCSVATVLLWHSVGVRAEGVPCGFAMAFLAALCLCPDGSFAVRSHSIEDRRDGPRGMGGGGGGTGARDRQCGSPAKRKRRPSLWGPVSQSVAPGCRLPCRLRLRRCARPAKDAPAETTPFCLLASGNWELGKSAA
jgi:hypothetical protein